jgi:hypothetical protein
MEGHGAACFSCNKEDPGALDSLGCNTNKSHSHCGLKREAEERVQRRREQKPFWLPASVDPVKMRKKCHILIATSLLMLLFGC